MSVQSDRKPYPDILRLSPIRTAVHGVVFVLRDVHPKLAFHLADRPLLGT